MITLQDFCHYLNVLLVAETFSDSCPNGLQVEGKPHIKRAATAVSASQATIEAAINAQVDVLVVHHGMFWQGDSPVVSGARREKLRRLLDHGISLLGYHSPLDAHQTVGNNWRAALDLDWTDLEPFGLFRSQLIGVKGSITPQSAESLKSQLEDYYEHPAHYAPGRRQEISRVALVSGGAHWTIKEAAAQGIHAFITGSFDEPIWNIAHEENVHFFAMGHCASERVGPKTLAEHIQHNLEIPTAFLDLPNPF